MTHDLLPPLPPSQPYVHIWTSDSGKDSLESANCEYFTADQMRAYALQAIEQYRKDAEMLDWLENTLRNGAKVAQLRQTNYLTQMVSWPIVIFDVSMNKLVEGNSLRAAIDAAMLRAKEPRK